MFEGSKNGWKHCSRIGMFFTFCKRRYQQCGYGSHCSEKCEKCHVEEYLGCGNWFDICRNPTWAQIKMDPPISPHDFKPPDHFYIHTESHEGKPQSFWSIRLMGFSRNDRKANAKNIQQGHIQSDRNPREFPHVNNTNDECMRCIDHMWVEASHKAQWDSKRRRLT